jgi:hypothetical protein
MAADTRDICSRLLEMPDAEFDELLAAGVLELPHAADG